MSKEILHRAKRTDTGEWVEGYYVKLKLTGTAYILPGDAEVEPCKKGVLQFVKYQVDPETVCRYTGLDDVKKRKIFERDICDRKEKFPEIVMYHNGDWTLDYSYANGKESGSNYCNLGFYVENRGGVEVIGNIFDDFELLEGRNE